MTLGLPTPRLKSTGVELLRALGLDWVPQHPERTFLGLRSRPIRTVIDVGANLGQFARRALAAFPDATLVCFEPLPAVYAELARWADNTGGRVRAQQLAIGDSNGVVRMFQHTEHSASSSILAATVELERRFPSTSSKRVVAVPLATLDQALAPSAGELHDEMIVKLDVQGYEARVIAGGRETFARAQACITEINIASLYRNQASMADIISMLHSSGLRYAGNLSQRYARDGRVTYLDAVFQRSA
jgi:FkbM family methyltransferase